MRIIHSADWHSCREHWDEALVSIRAMAADALANGCDLFAIAGDLADGPMQDSERDIFDRLCSEIQGLANIAPVAIIYGTPSHDAPGSLEVLERLSCKYGITILRPGKAYGIRTADRIIVELKSDDFASHSAWQLLLFGVPEPNKKWLLADSAATGKEASDQAVREAMRNLLLGLGAIRRDHADLPCVLLYHGQVSGARSSTGFGVESGTGLAISRDDLAAVGADYLALGDIHLPQQIGDLPAYYPGKIYTGNWNEQNYVPGANVVEFTGDCGFISKVSRLEFPHPMRVKISRKADDGWQYKDHEEDLSANLVWEEWTLTREEAEAFDPEAELGFLLSTCGALPGSQVTVKQIATETVRAGEITTKKTLREKVQVWGENSSTPIPESALLKTDELEREAAAQGASISGAHIRMTRLRLRGAKGIWKNQRIDEIDLDLEALGEGVLALVGANGQGKTTILENLHPWPKMLTRDGTLKGHFRLRDSFRDLYFTDDRTGYRYRALIQINAATASGGAEYFLSCDQGGGKGYEPVGGSTGRLEPYETAVTELFGSLPMYLRTAFQTQRPSKYAPDLAEATKGEKKDLFVELSGLDYLVDLTKAAKAQGDALEGDLARLDGTILAAADVEAVIAQAEAAILDAEERARASQGDAERMTARGQTLKAEEEALALRVKEIERREARRAEIRREVERLVSEIKTCEEESLGFQAAAAARSGAEAELAKVAELEGEAAALQEEERVLLAAWQVEAGKVQDAQRQTDADRRAAQAELDARRRELSDTERVLAGLKARLTAPIADHCPTCAQLLPEEKRAHLAEERERIEIEVQEAEAARLTREEGVQDAQRALESIVYPQLPVRPGFPKAGRLAEIKADLDFFDPAALRLTIRKADEAAVRIEASGRRKADAEARKAPLEEEAQAVDALPPDTAREDLLSKHQALETAREQLTLARSAIAAAKAFGDAAKGNLEAAQARRKARDEAQAARDTTAATLADWRLLERAFGADGIQALELDALAPSIAQETNALLAVQSDRYSVRFDTTRQSSGSAKRSHQIEDFLIQVLDAETGEEQEIGTLSGGEGVWIRKALYDGFAIIRARNTGVQFRTVFLDEADGALDPEARMQYLRMLEAAHRKSGRAQTIIITHSRELQAMVGQVIDVMSLEVKDNEAKESAA